MKSLKVVFQRQLQESRVRRVVLKKLFACHLSALWTNSLVRRIRPRRMIQQVEGVRAELQKLLAEGSEVFE